MKRAYSADPIVLAELAAVLRAIAKQRRHAGRLLRGMANAFYRERISQHLSIALNAIDLLNEGGAAALHSRKLRSFDEPAFR